MAFDSYASLKTSAGSWLRRSDLTALIPDFIVLAETEMNRALRTSFQLTSAAYSITGEFVAKPTGFRMMRTLRLTSGTGRQLREVTPEEMVKRKAVPTVLVAEPREFTAIGAQFEFWPIPDQTYSAQMEYQTGFTPLSDANTSNWILADHPDAYLFGTLSMGFAYAKNTDMAGQHAGQFARVLDEVQGALRTSYDRTLRVDPALRSRASSGGYNWLTGE